MSEVKMNIREYLKKNILVFDGAMGTYYADLHRNSSRKCELGNLTDEATVFRIHREYIEVGCKAIRTNTFGANETCLNSNFDLVRKVITRGYKIAEKAIEGTGVYLFADIGPIPYQYDTDLLADYKKVVDVFLELGAVNFLFETFSSAEYLPEIAGYIKSKNPNSFIITQFAITPDGYTRQGNSGLKIFQEMARETGIDGLGFNCVSGPYHLLEFIKKVDIGDKLVSIMPNAGYPTVIDNRTFFESNAEYFSKLMTETAGQGVSILGGCCGTTPEFLKKTVLNLNHLGLEEISTNQRETSNHKILSDPKNKLAQKIQNGKKIIAVELDPPADTDIEFFMESAQKLKDSRVDAITIADCPIARARVDSSFLAYKLKRELGLIPIPHMTCRDRNINATKALLLGLNIEGIDNVLVVTGDPIPSAQRDEVKGIFNFNSVILANYIRTLNENTFRKPFTIYGALNVNAQNFEAQLKHAQRKVDNGVTVFLTQPILTEQAQKNLQKAREVLPAKILGGILPIVSYKNACFINNEISGISVAEEVIEMYKDVSKEQATKIAIDISTSIAREISAKVDGYYIITPFKRVDLVLDIIENINTF